MKGLTRALAAVGFGLLVGLSPAAAAAHGKDVQITLDSWVPEPTTPLTRLYEAHVVYAADLEPVVGARLSFRAARQEGGLEVADVAFVSLDGSPGVYLGQVQYPRYGAWDVTLRTEVPGVGEATTTEQVQPSGPVRAASRTAADSTRVTVSLQFDWHDVLNILVRIGHSVAAAAYLAGAGVLLLNLRLGSYLRGARLWRTLTSWAMPVSLGSLGVLVASGVYAGAVDGPVRAPGVFDAPGMVSVAYGSAYLTAFWLKLVLGLGVLGVIALARSSYALVGGSVHAFTRLGAAYGVLVLLLLADVVVLVYLHSLSHLSAFASPR